METDICGVRGCGESAAVHLYRLERRTTVNEIAYCAMHIDDFLIRYRSMKRCDERRQIILDNAIVFDIEVILCDSRADHPSQLFLHEVGGCRRLEIGTGLFEAWALQLETGKLATARPLTHRAMDSVISALGGKLEYVVIDKYFPNQIVAYEAKLYIRQGGRNFVVDVRPSDAIVLAVVCDVPIAVCNDVALAASGEK
jgi:bifunctional DNase/RNase